MDILTFIKSKAHIMEPGNLEDFLDTLIKLTTDQRNLQAFDTKEMDVAQCLGLLVDILNEPQPNPSLSHRALLLLYNLTEDEGITQVLHSSYHLASTLSSFLLNCCENTNTPDIKTQAVKCIEVMRKVTYNARIAQQDNHIPELLKYLTKNITEPETELTKPSLGLLANLCRHSVPVQAFIKSMENNKNVFKCLIKFLSHSSDTIKIYAMLTWCSLYIHEESGEKFFQEKNTHQTFQMIFNIVVATSAGSDIPRGYAVDLLIDIIKLPQIQRLLIGYRHLEMTLRELLASIPHVQRSSKLFELLLAFCSVTCLRRVVCQTLFDSPALQDSIIYQEMMAENNLTEPFFAVVHRARQPVETHGKAPILALDLLREVYEEAIDSGLTSKLTLQSELVLPMVTEILMAPMPSSPTTRDYLKVVKALQLLKVLCLDDVLKAQVGGSIDVKTCRQLIDYQLNHSRIADIMSKKIPESGDLSDTGVDIVLHTIDVALGLKDIIPQINTKFSCLLQDSRVVPFFAYAMTSESRDRVHLALKLLTIGVQQAEFPATLLGDNISTFNSKLRQKERLDDKLAIPMPVSVPQFLRPSINKENTCLMPHPLTPKTVKKVHSMDEDVNSLIAKMHAGLDIKNSTTTELIEIYSHKLRSLETKERHQQDLLDAKTLALAQADRLISNLRCQSAKSEAEAHRLQLLILESEKYSEKCRDEMNELMSERSQLKHHLHSQTEENKRLQAIVEEHEQLLVEYSTQRQSYDGLYKEHRELTSAYHEKCLGLQDTEKQLADLQQQNQTMLDMQHSNQKHIDSLMQQVKEKSSQLLDLEQQHRKMKASMTADLADKEASVERLLKTKSHLEEKLSEGDKDIASLRDTVKKHQKNIDKLEKNKSSLQEKIGKLEEKTKKLDSACKTKEKQLRELQAELEKHSKIAAMIHNLSSGKVVTTNMSGIDNL